MPAIFVTVHLTEQLAAQFPDELELPPHVTVLYIPEVAPELVPEALAAIGGVIERGWGFDLELSGLGHFDHPAEQRRVAWAGVTKGDQELRDLRRDLLASLCAAGVAAPQRHPSYTAHATIAFLDGDASWSGPVPAGSMRVDALRVTVDETPADLSLGERAESESTARAWREAASGPADLSSPFVAATVGPVYTRSGEPYGEITPTMMAEFVRVFAARCDEDPVHIDWDHGSALGGPPEVSGALGRIVEMWVEGDKLWMRPRLNNRGRRVVADHEAGDESDLWPSPEFLVDPAGIKCRRTNRPYGWAQVLAVAATTRPAQVATAVTPLRLSERRTLADRERYAVDPMKIAELLRAKGCTEEEIQAALGDDYVSPEGIEPAAADAEATAMAEEEDDAEGPKVMGEDDAGEPKVMAEGEDDVEKGVGAEKVSMSERRLQRQIRALEGQVNTMFAERRREQREALDRHVDAEYQRAITEGRCPNGEEARFAFNEQTRQAEQARLLARKANPNISEGEIAKLPEVRVWHAHYGEPRPDLADLAATHGHGRRPDEAEAETDPLFARLTKFAEERKCTYAEADATFWREHRAEYERLERRRAAR